MARGQIWSMDLVIGVLIFLLAAGILASFALQQEERSSAGLTVASEVVAQQLSSDTSVKVAEEGALNMQELYNLAERTDNDYESVRSELGVNYEFCIYLQDEDGNLVYIRDESSGNRYAGIGSGADDITLTENRIPCGELV